MNLLNWPKIPTAPFCPSEVAGTVVVPNTQNAWRRLFAFAGPGLLVAVGYMDPGNWATDLAGGASFGYALLSVILLSNLMAMLLQSLCVRLGLVTGQDLAQMCRSRFDPKVNFVLWVFAEIAIIACDLAELLGSALALNLLFGLPLAWGVVLTGLDVFLVLLLQGKGFRWLEVLMLGLISLIGICFVLELWFSQPAWDAVFGGFIPTLAIVQEPKQLYLAISIIGATVMPHNLYLHSAIVQTRAWQSSNMSLKQVVRYATIDSTVALFFALLINSSILIVSAATFHFSGNQDVTDLREAYKLLAPLLGTGLASTLFGVALLAAGQSSTFTGTLAGQVIMEGFLDLRIPCWLRRLITRGLAMIPALVSIIIFGEEGVGPLLVLSQVVLSLQLPFAVFPLILFTGNRSLMGDFVSPVWLQLGAWMIGLLIAGLNVWLLISLGTASN